MRQIDWGLWGPAGIIGTQRQPAILTAPERWWLSLRRAISRPFPARHPPPTAKPLNDPLAPLGPIGLHYKEGPQSTGMGGAMFCASCLLPTVLQVSLLRVGAGWGAGELGCTIT